MHCSPEGFQNMSEGTKTFFDAPVAASSKLGILTSFLF
jgi:hypothetical protein